MSFTYSVINVAANHIFPTWNKGSEVSHRIWNIHDLQTALEHFALIIWSEDSRADSDEILPYLQNVCHGRPSETPFFKLHNDEDNKMRWR